MKRTLGTATVIAITVIAHLAIARLGTAHPNPPKVSSVGSVLVERPLYVRENQQGVVTIKGHNSVFLVSARDGDQVFDAQVAFGRKASASFQGGNGNGVEFDVFELKQLGKIDVEGFKPCTPTGPNRGDCTPPQGFPPKLPPTFLSLALHLNLLEYNDSQNDNGKK